MSAEIDTLLNNLVGQHIRFVQVSGQLDPSKRERAGVCGEWSPRQVIAHLAGWDHSLNRFISDPASFIPPGDIDGFNAASVSDREHQSWAESLTELQDGMNSLQAAVSTVTTELKIYPRVEAWLQGRSADYELHTGQLAVWIEGSGSGT
jgi:hypothetical protein